VKHLLTLADLTSDELFGLLRRAGELKRELKQGRDPRPRPLVGRTQGMLFEKPSLRTRVSFEAAMTQLGGASIFLGAEAGWGRRESLADFARTLTRYVDVFVFRGNDHATVEMFSSFASCPVINGLTQREHPCQALADIFTVQECFPDLAQVRVAFVGDGNNVARSLATACAMTGTAFALGSPRRYGFDASFQQSLRARYPGATLEATDDPREAVRGADVVYTDVWASMGEEAEREQRQLDLRAYQVNQTLMQCAKPHARFMHCLPARRGEEVTDEIIDGPQSIVFDQAENRMHAQKALLLHLLIDNG
jgi:ornithine carbamoyltransferase